MEFLTQEKLINSLRLLYGSDVIFLLGAGCSIMSGCMPANKLILEFKKRIYCAKHDISYDESTLFNDENLIKLLNQEQPPKGTNPYSYFFNQCFASAHERNLFIKEKFENINPSYGYLCFANYLINNQIKYVLTTNFDKLCEKAIRKIDENYDYSVTSDSLSPNVDTKFNLVKLHGDYIYDDTKNTEEELQHLSPKIISQIQNIKTSTIVVIGYSGQDLSVMGCLKEYLSKNSNTKLIWCVINKEEVGNPAVDELLSLNGNSRYCLISGFDNLFIRLYHVCGVQNPIIEAVRNNMAHNDFAFKNNHQPENLLFNCFPLQNHPLVYKIQYPIDPKLLKELNSENSNFFILQHKEYLYCVGSIEVIMKKLNTNAKYDVVDLCEQNISLSKKCKLIKEVIKLISLKNGYSLYRDNIFTPQKDTIQEGLHIYVDCFNGEICLLPNVNYFSTNKFLSDGDKFKINAAKSRLYASQNFDKLNADLQKYFNNSFMFNLGVTHLNFSNKAFGHNTNCIQFNDYDCALEPIMVGETFKSANQIKIITEHGPRKTLFSAEKIRVGIFCAEEDKVMLKAFLDKLVNGTNSLGTDLIPKYKGFASVFNKNIELLYDILPPFYADKIAINQNIDFERFAQMCVRGIVRMYNEKQIDIALIYIGNNLKRFRTDDTFKDLHDYIKLNCVNRYKTQFLEENTLKSSDNINKKILNLAIGIYTKTIGMSWYPENYSKDTLFLGISFGVDSNGVNVGCSQMFDGAGRGMQLIISKVADKHRKNQYLSEDEAYQLGIRIRQTYYKTSKIDELKRIVIHRTDPFRKEEIAGFKKAFEGIDDFDLLQISDYTFFNAYKFNNQRCLGYPLTRGTTIKAMKDTIFVWTDGSINNADIISGRTYRNNTRGMGKPLKIRKFYGKISANEAVADLMYLTKMDFNSSDVIYSKLPVTIKYSRIVCKLLKQGDLKDELVSFEYVM